MRLFITCVFIIVCSAHPVAHQPLFSDFLHAASTHLEKRNLHESLYYISKAVAVIPQESEHTSLCRDILFNLGIHFFLNKDPDNALAAFEKILTLTDNFAPAYHNIGFTLAEYGNYQESIEWYRKALAIEPKSAASHLALAVALLAHGDYLQGFKEYEWRWLPGGQAPRSFSGPLEKVWDGTTSVNHKRILIRAEQGLGDMIQFIRYAQLLHADGALVTAEVFDPLGPLLSLCPYINQVVTGQDPLPPFDFQVPLLNLPAIYKTTVNSVPTPDYYLYANKELVQFWYDRLHDDTTFKIGICWYGAFTHCSEKFMPLLEFARLREIPNITIYSLQQISGLDQLEQQDARWLHQFDDDFDTTHGNFMDTAAVMKNLDLIITVDTSIAHLAGALGVPTWVILPFPAEWRWLVDRSDSVWYSSMRLFRKQKSQSWTEVMDNICNELIMLLSQHHS